MIHYARYWISIILVMICCSAFGQHRDVRDKALDRYEVICNRLIELRDAIRRGEKISSQDMSALMAEMRSIRSNLNKSPEGLTPEQTMRFNRIRRRYNYGPDLKRLSNPLAGRVALQSRKNEWEVDEQLQKIRYGRYVYPDKRFYAVGKSGFLILAQVSPYPDPSFGASAGYLKNNIGFYASAMTNLKSRSAGIEVLSDGTSSGSPVWVTGRQEKTKMVFTAGGLFRVADKVSLLAGAGYGSRKLFWENSSGDWMRVTDCSYTGVAAEAGILFTLGRWESFCISAKVGTVSFKYADFTLGIGYRF